jgi:transcriptional regulator with XRE-family HTH domain
MSEQKEIGKILKEAREKKDVTLKEVSKSTRISLSVLEILEKSEYKKLPSYIHALGFLKLYANYLGLNFEELKDIFEREYKGELYKEEEAKEALNEVIENVKKPKNRKNYIIVVTVILCVILSFVYLITYLETNNNPSKIADKPVNTKSVPLDIKKENVTEDTMDNQGDSDKYSVLSPMDLAKQLKESEQEEKAELRSVTFEFSDTCWVHINIDGKHEIDFIADAGSNKIIEFLNFFEIDVGNASAIKIKYKDQTFTGLGGWRQPVKNLYFSIDNSGNLVFLKK